MKRYFKKVATAGIVTLLLSTSSVVASTHPSKLQQQYPIDKFVSPPSSPVVDYGPSRDELDQSYESTHFIIHYTENGSNATNLEFAQAVGKAADAAYNKLIAQEHAAMPFTNKIPVDIANLGYGDNGLTEARYDGNKYQVSMQIGSQTHLDRLPGLVAHEFTHVIEYIYYQLDDSTFLLESLPTWVSYEVAPNCTFWQMADEWYFEPDLYMSGNRMGSILFLIYLEQKYGITPVKVMEAESEYKDMDALRAVLATKNVTLEQAFKNFSVDSLTTKIGKNSDLKSMQEPSYIASITWDGASKVVSKNTRSIIHDRMTKFAGSQLNIRNLYGVDFIQINPNVSKTMNVHINNKNLSISLIGVKSNGTRVSLNGTKITNPSQYDIIIASIIKLSDGSGKYTLTLN